MDTRTIRHLLKEPLFHFLLIGACLFGVYGLVNPGALQDDHTIVADQGRIASWSLPAKTRMALTSIASG